MKSGQVWIEGEGISLAPLQGLDWEYVQLIAWLSDVRVLEFYEGRDRPCSPECACEKFDPVSRATRNEFPGLIWLNEQPIGYIQYYLLQGLERSEYGLPDERTAYGLDLFIGQPDLWGQGLGQRAVYWMAEFLFRLSAGWVVLDPQVQNLRAIRCYERCGFQKLRLAAAHELHEGEWHDCWLMAKQRKAD